jgi:hypothetical protein
MQFVKTLRDRVRSGEITTSVRLWQKPRVRVGGQYWMAPGQRLFFVTFRYAGPDAPTRKSKK